MSQAGRNVLGMLFDAGCVVCGSSRGPVCRGCAALLPPAPAREIAGLDRCRVAFELDDRTRTIIAALKYRRQRRLARWLAAAMVEHVPRAVDVLTWVPATPERVRLRGFDQARELARSLSALTGVPAVRLLRRASLDVRQTGLTRAARLHGPELRITRASPASVVLIDDVVTTGSSLRVAAAALTEGGTRRVFALAAAATPLAQDRPRRCPDSASRIDGWT